MNKSQTLLALAQRLSGAERPSFRLERDIAKAVHAETRYPRFMRDLQQALTLLPPGSLYTLSGSSGPLHLCSVMFEDARGTSRQVEASSTLPVASVAAAGLQALAALGTAKLAA